MSLQVCEVLRQWRWASRRELKEVAKEIGVGDSTLSRFERGEAVGGDTLAKILTWLINEAPAAGPRPGLDVPREPAEQP